MEEKIRNISHKLTLDNRKEALLTGVKDVVSFDEKEILLQTSEGRLQIRGSQLHVKGLDLEKGEAVLAGHVKRFPKKRRTIIYKVVPLSYEYLYP